jgi:hypothetical protein
METPKGGVSHKPDPVAESSKAGDGGLTPKKTRTRAGKEVPNVSATNLTATNKYHI